MSKLSAEAYAIIEGRHSDPFHYLGLHKEDDKMVVRAFLPEAPKVEAVGERGCAPFAGKWYEVFNSGSAHYGGSNVGNFGKVLASNGPVPALNLTVPPLAAIFLIPDTDRCD